MSGVVLAPLRLEAAALRRGAPALPIELVGMGPNRARATAARVAAAQPDAALLAGVAGALDPTLRVGDLVVATELRDGETVIACPGADLVAGALRRHGLTVRTGPIASVSRPLTGLANRAALHADGALAVDMESAYLAAALPVPLTVVRVILDTPDEELFRPRLAANVLRCARTLAAAAPVLDDWRHACAARRVLLCAPRAFCAGVERAITTVERLLDDGDAPVHVRGEIVHNRHVVDELTARGARLVGDVDEVPEGGLVVLSAHGVAPGVRDAARRRGLRTIDATCPLVAKVHTEARRFADAGYTIVLVGHRDHDEVIGTLGQAPGRIHVIATPEEVEHVPVEDPQRVAWLTQTTLAVDETAVVVDALRRRFPAIVGPRRDDICFATQNRQTAVRRLAPDCDRFVIVGSANSSNTRRLVEVAERYGAAARRIDDATGLDPGWLAGARTVGVTAGASAPEALVRRVVAALGALGPVDIAEHAVARERARFGVPVAAPAREREGAA